ncbi:hypothetical protein [Schaalia sp. ZJ1691]|uniref:hypothetical protein n=1 Tax=Schaalia sp. ZJ1691 TaxID=2709404 RepID=UPI0013EB6EF1|nr:hypothetical protein [Schaalia sp. ZJ1691]
MTDIRFGLYELKRQPTVEALRYTGDNGKQVLSAVHDLGGFSAREECYYENDRGTSKFSTNIVIKEVGEYTGMVVRKGEWIVYVPKTVRVMDDEDFRAMYQPVKTGAETSA